MRLFNLYNNTVKFKYITQKTIKNTILIFALTLILFLNGCISTNLMSVFPSESTYPGLKNTNEKEFDERYKYLVQSNTQNHQVGGVKSVIEYGEHFVIGAHYPIFEIEEIDMVTKSFVEEIISDFYKKVENFETVDSDLKAELNIDYETWLAGQDLASIRFNILMNIPGCAYPEVKVETAVWNLKTSHPVLLENILVDGGLSRLAELVREELSANQAYSEYYYFDTVSSGTDAQYENCSSYLFTQESLVLVFERYPIFPGAADELVVEIPYENLHDVFDLSSFAVNNDTKLTSSPDDQLGLEYPEHLKDAEDPSSDNLNTIRQIDLSKPMVALTFDDGPFEQITKSILDTLGEYDAVATFFILGNRVADNPDILERMVHEGSEIGNHSLSHKQLTTLSLDELQYQIEETQRVVESATGIRPVMMRPTYGSYSSELQERLDLPMILWSIDPRDWEIRDATHISKHVLENVQDGDIVLMHDIYDTTAEAVKIIVPQLIQRGYQLVTVSELYAAKGVVLEAGKIYRGETGNNLSYES